MTTTKTMDQTMTGNSANDTAKTAATEQSVKCTQHKHRGKKSRFKCANCGTTFSTKHKHVYDPTGKAFCAFCLEFVPDIYLYYNNFPESSLRFIQGNNEVPTTHNGNVRYFWFEIDVHEIYDLHIARDCFVDLNGSLDYSRTDYAYLNRAVFCVDDDCWMCFEIDGQPMTRQALEEFRPSLANALRHMQYYQECEPITAGLHFHVSRNSLGEQTIENMVAALDRYWDTCLRLSRWSSAQLAHYSNDYVHNYCSYFSGRKQPDLSCNKPIIDRAKLSVNPDPNLYFVINVNPNTVELRLFRGTLDADTFYASLDFFCALIDFAEKHTRDEISQIPSGEFIEYLRGYSKALCDYVRKVGL